jgi:hypothetical protein
MTEGDSLTKKIAADQVPDLDNIRESVVTFSDVNTGDAVRQIGSSIIVGSVIVDATEQLEAHRGLTSSGKLVPGVKDVTQGVQDAVRNAKSYVKIFRVDNEIFEVNQEQLDRVRMSKCAKKEGTGPGTSRGDIASTNADCSSFFYSNVTQCTIASPMALSFPSTTTRCSWLRRSWQGWDWCLMVQRPLLHQCS